MIKHLLSKMNFRYLLVLLFVVTLNSCKAQGIDASKVKNNLPEFSWDTMPLYMHLRKSTSFTKEELKFLAKHPLITFEKTTGSKTYGSTEDGTLVAAKAVKKLNPDTKILYYKNVVINWAGYKADRYFFQKHPDAYLVNSSGEKAVMPNKKTGFFDISKDYVRSHWLDHVGEITSSPYIDGVFMDANIKVLAPGFFGNRVGNEKQKQVEAGYLTMMKDLNTRYGKDNILLANILRVRPNFKDVGRSYLKYFDGSYIEGFEHENFGMTYEDYLAKGIEAVQKSAREGNIIAMSLGLGKALKNAETGIDDVRKKLSKKDNFAKRLDYLLAIFLVCAEKYSYVYPHDGYATNRSAVWMKTFPQYEKKLGAPKGDAKKDGYVYTRSFEHLDVVLDIKNKTAQLNWK
ncbi:putative glycoside hydrolase [Flavivirga jejuensis]|uniref:Glycoside hydrolase n=1 Tax=Flavivirga jejuensis TaxID=870487 RepID=A0ABT8WL02_9FLAO|nr:putative glycoside hydrolase [Flavivirga jejuensis]MDO5973835.1 putative glycoside hydrolase [Flavivirga jejuensis]